MGSQKTRIRLNPPVTTLNQVRYLSVFLFSLAVITSLLTIEGCSTKPENSAPVAAFVIIPATGTVDTTFTFDATGSSDPDEDLRYLQVRWDWDGDGSWDSLWGAKKDREHQFSQRGSYTIKMEIKDSWGEVSSTEQDLIVGNYPVASFTINPVFGTVDTLFTFDAAACSNPGGDDSGLELRWDWENDGVWDSDWSTTLLQQHRFSVEGTYQTVLEIRNSSAFSDTCLQSVRVYPANSSPTALFTVIPDSGSVSTTFQFDASGSSDPQDHVDLLVLRWDWEADGVWDTEWDTIKTASHKYEQPGTYTVTLNIKDTDGFEDFGNNQVLATNSPPVASFTVNHQSGDLLTNFEFDASGSSDPDEPSDTLEVRWDWESDGLWDIQWTTQKTATHSYTVIGDHQVTLEVRDFFSLTDLAQHTVSVSSAALGPHYWSYYIGISGTSTTPAIADDGTIYVGGTYRDFFAVNSNGTLKWQYLTGEGINSTPTIGADGTIYFATGSGNLVALRDDGALRWSAYVGGNISTSPTLGHDGTIYIGSNTEGLVAFDSGGTEIWRAATGSIPLSSAAVATDSTIYVGSYQYFNAVNPDGSFKWRYPLTASVSSPAIGSDGTVYFAFEGKIVALNKDGTLKWEKETGYSIWSEPVIGPGDIICVGSGQRLFVLNSDGTERWNYNTGGLIYASPTVGSDGTIYIGSYDGYLYALDDSGNLSNRFYDGDDIGSGASITASGILYFGSDSGYLHAIQCQSSGLASAFWPKFARDNKNTGRK